jgi:hypothetical protein
VSRAALLAATLVLAGCGASVQQETSGVRPLDEPAPAELIDQLRKLQQELEAAPDTRENKVVKRVLLGTIPAADSTPRAVAELELTPHGMLRLFAWQARSGRLCLWLGVGTRANEEPIEGGPIGPCMGDRRCRELCIEQERVELGRGRTVVAGAVPSDGDGIRLLSLLQEEPIELDLDGPELRAFPGWRVVLVDLGRRSYALAELLEDGRVVDRRRSVGWDYATEDCFERAGEDEEKREACL